MRIVIQIAMTDGNGPLNIGSFSLCTKLNVETLHFYDKKRLLVPTKKEIIGYRIHAYEQIRRRLILKRLTDLGLGHC